MHAVLPFFARQALVANSGGFGTEFYSETFVVLDFSQIEIEFRLYATSSSASCTAFLYEAADPCLDDACWNSIWSAALTAPGSSRGTLVNPLRFIRAKVKLSGASMYSTVMVSGIGRGP
jgi:hypothetical protein